MLRTYHTFEHEGKKYKFVYDEHYRVERSCGGANGRCNMNHHSDPADAVGCEKFYQDEIEKLDAGEWVALGVMVYELCAGGQRNDDGTNKHCTACDGWVETDEDLWGIVIENMPQEAEKFVKDGNL